MRIHLVSSDDLSELLPLLRAYCEFYDASTPVDALREVVNELLRSPSANGFQLLALENGEAVGFATVYWCWSTLKAGRVAILNDLFVQPAARRSGIGEALIREAARLARAGGARSLLWDTHRDNDSAQRLYDTVGATRSDEWVDYEMVL